MTRWVYLISKVICKLNCSLNISLVTPKLYPWNARQWMSILRNKSSSISTHFVPHPSVMKFSKMHCCSTLFSTALKHQLETTKSIKMWIYLAHVLIQRYNWPRNLFCNWSQTGLFLLCLQRLLLSPGTTQSRFACVLTAEKSQPG